MASCKDCLHYEVCKRIDYELEYHNKSIKEAEEELPIKCRFFRNKADFQEVKHGYWHLLDDCANEGVYCSVCNKKVYKTDYANQKIKSKYCPNCGAKMDGGKNE